MEGSDTVKVVEDMEVKSRPAALMVSLGSRLATCKHSGVMVLAIRQAAHYTRGTVSIVVSSGSLVPHYLGGSQICHLLPVRL